MPKLSLIITALAVSFISSTAIVSLVDNRSNTMDHCATTEVLRSVLEQDSMSIKILIDNAKVIMVQSLKSNQITVWNWNSLMDMFCIQPLKQG